MWSGWTIYYTQRFDIHEWGFLGEGGRGWDCTVATKLGSGSLNPFCTFLTEELSKKLNLCIWNTWHNSPWRCTCRTVHWFELMFDVFITWLSLASEKKNFLLYYAVPLLLKHLPDIYVLHLMLLVGGIYRLLKETISVQERESSASCLKLFCAQAATLYGMYMYTVMSQLVCSIPSYYNLFDLKTW